MDVINVRVGKGGRGFYSFKGIDAALAERGHRVIQTRVHPTGSIERRAGELKKQLLEKMGDQSKGAKVIIVAHSMGGLDARYMISRLGMGKHVAALLTVGSPHRGTTYAEYMLGHMKRLGATKLCKMIGWDVEGIADLTPEACARFNEKVVDDPEVRYFSVSAACEAGAIPVWGRRAHRIITEREGANDGLVSVWSATYANHLGTWPVDHWTLLNKPFGSNRDSRIVERYLGAIERVCAGGL